MLTLIANQLHFIPQGIIITILVFVFYLYVKDNKGKTVEKIKEFIRNDFKVALFLFYTVLLFTGTIIARPYTNPLTNMIGYFGFVGWADQFNYMGLVNILIFVPYIFVYIIAFNPEKPFRNSILLTIITTVFIEIIQLVFCVGQSCLADMIHNVIGGILGYIIWRLVRCVRKE